MRLTMLILLVAFAAGSAHRAFADDEPAPPLATIKDVQKAINQAVDHLSNNRIEDGLSLLELHRLGNDEPNSKGFTERAAPALHAIQAKFGKGLGYHLVREQTLGDVLHRREYIIKLDRQLVYAELVFYKPKDRWWLYSVNFYTKPEEYLPKAFPGSEP